MVRRAYRCLETIHRRSRIYTTCSYPLVRVEGLEPPRFRGWFWVNCVYRFTTLALLVGVLGFEPSQEHSSSAKGIIRPSRVPTPTPLFWCTRLDSNQGPDRYELSALTAVLQVRIGARSRIRTYTTKILSLLTLPVGLCGLCLVLTEGLEPS